MTDLHYCVKNLEHQVQVIQKWIDAHDVAHKHVHVSRSVEYADQPPSAALNHAIDERDKALAERDAAVIKSERLALDFDNEQRNVKAWMAAREMTLIERDKALARVEELEQEITDIWGRHASSAVADKIAKLESDLAKTLANLSEERHIRIKREIGFAAATQERETARNNEIEAIAQLKACRGELSSAQRRQIDAESQVAKLAGLLREVRLEDTRDGCPMCDYGKLRKPAVGNGALQHWPSCTYAKIDSALAEVKS